MDDGVILHLHAVIENLLPHDVAVLGGETAHDVQQLLDVDGLKLVVIAGHIPLPHEGCDLRIALPENHTHQF